MRVTGYVSPWRNPPVKMGSWVYLPAPYPVQILRCIRLRFGIDGQYLSVWTELLPSVTGTGETAELAVESFLGCCRAWRKLACEHALSYEFDSAIGVDEFNRVCAILDAYERGEIEWTK